MRGYILGKTVLIRADHPEYTSYDIGRHEAGHGILNRLSDADRAKAIDDVRQRLKSVVGEENVDEVARLYAYAYEDSDLTDEEIFEEFICDALGEMNVFKVDAELGDFASMMLPEARAAAKSVMSESAKNQTRGSPESEAKGRTSRELDNFNADFNTKNIKLGEKATNVTNETNKSELLRRNANDSRSGSAEISSESGRIVSDGNKGGVFAGTGEGRILSYDTEGRVISDELISKIKNTAIKDKNGRPIVVYHATSKTFEKFSIGDIGFHFGSKFQATSRAENKKINNPKYIRAYLNIETPLIIEKDYMNWHANAAALHLWNDGIFNESEMNSVISLWAQGREYDSPAAKKVREILRDKGYDGIAYKNEFEGEGYSFIAFNNNQIIRSQEEGKKGDYSRELEFIDYLSEKAKREGREETEYKPLTNRDLLASALESVAEHPEERKLLESYKAEVEDLNAAEARLREVQSDLKALTFKKGPRDNAAIELLNKEKGELIKKIDRSDKRLLRLEAMESLKAVMEREKQKAKYKQKHKNDSPFR